MRARRGSRLLLALLAMALCAAPALAQQPDTAAPAPAPAKKKHKPAAAAAADTTAAAPSIGGAKPTLLGQFGDWGAFTASPGGKKICFAIAKPASSETNPPGKPRNPSYIFIATRPAEKVSDEVSVVIGYPFKANSEATVAVGSTTYVLYTQQDGAWVKNAAEEANLIAAMKTGQNAVLKGVSARGTHSTDIFSLKGLSQALDRSDQDCK